MVYVRLAFAVAVVIGADLLCLVQADTECADGYKLFQESCYRLSNTEATRPDAAAACSPGHLVDIKSVGEHEFIVNLLTGNGIDDAWFGLLKTRMLWSDGSTLVYESWQEIVVNGGDSCFRLEQRRGYTWNDIGCSALYMSICEYEISGSEDCREGFENFQRSCYQINHDALNRADAAAACGTAQMHLADITSNGEQEFVVELLETSGQGFSGRGDVWFGLIFLDSPSWSDGSLLMEASWQNIRCDGDPICFILQHRDSEEDLWNDISCTNNYKYVCEYEVITATTSAIPDISNSPLETWKTDDKLISATTKVTQYISHSRSETSNTDVKVVTEAKSIISTSKSTTLQATVVLGMQKSNRTGVIIGVSVGIVVVVIIFVTGFAIVIIYFRRTLTTEKRGENNLTDLKTTTTTQPSQQDPDQVPDYQNVSNPDKSTVSETYIGLDQTSRQSEAVYQGMTNPKELNTTDDYLSPDVNVLSKTDAEYQSLNDKAMLGKKKTNQDLIYHEIAENKEDQYDYAYVNPTKASIPAVNSNNDGRDVYVNANIRVRKS